MGKAVGYGVVSFDEILKNIDYYAKEFAEESIDMENTLKLLWKNRFETVGCCVGHNNRDEAYIAFLLRDDDGRLVDVNNIIKLLSSLDKGKIHISFVAIGKRLICGIKSYGNSNMYKNIQDNVNGAKIDNRIEYIVKGMLKRKSNDYMNVHLYYEADVPKVYLNVLQSESMKRYINRYKHKIVESKFYSFIIDNDMGEDWLNENYGNIIE